MTHTQFDAILESLKSGSPLDQAIRSAGVNSADFAAQMRQSSHLAEAVDAACQSQRQQQKQQQSYRDIKPNELLKDDESFGDEDDGSPAPENQSEGFERAMDQALQYGDGLIGQLEWVEQRCALAGRHAMDKVWRWNCEQFFRSGKLKMVDVAGLRAGKTTSLQRAIVPVALFSKHKVEAGEIAGIPVMSSRTNLATMTLNEFEIILTACGMKPTRKGAESLALPGGIDGEFKRTNASSGGGVIEFINAHGARVRIMCLAANVASAVGYTAVGAFLDEIEIWTSKAAAANPATEVLEAVQQRATTTFDTAKLFISSSYYPDRTRKYGKGALQSLIEAGDSDTVYIARLGEEGARRDTAARLRLAREIGSSDPRLLVAGDPATPSIPAWASRLDLDISTLYKQTGGNLDKLFGLYGGRIDCGGTSAGDYADWITQCSQRVNALNRNERGTLDGKRGNSEDEIGLIRGRGLPAYDPRSNRYGAKSGGRRLT